MTAQQHADNFTARNNGKYIDEDRQYGSQCWDVVARYAREEYGCPSFPTVTGGAEGLWSHFANPIPQYFSKVSRDQLAPGDIAVWDASFYPPYGHTALVWQRSGNTIFVLEQDGSKDPNGDGNADGVAYLAHRDITTKLSGGLRPKGAGTEDMVDLNAARLLVRLAFYHEPADDSFTSKLVGKDIYEAIRMIEALPERQNVTAKLNSSDSEAVEKIKQIKRIVN